MAMAVTTVAGNPEAELVNSLSPVTLSNRTRPPPRSSDPEHIPLIRQCHPDLTVAEIEPFWILSIYINDSVDLIDIFRFWGT